MKNVAIAFLLAATVATSFTLAAAPIDDNKTVPAEPQAETGAGTNQAAEADAEAKPADKAESIEKKPKEDKTNKEKKEAKVDKTKKGAKAIPYPLETCIVTDNKLDSMGDKRTIVHEGQEIKFCCKPCETKFKKDPARYLPKLKA